MNEAPGAYGYGAAGSPGYFEQGDYAQKLPFEQPPPVRRRLNLAAICINLLVPWLLYIAVTALLGFSMPVLQPVLCNALLLLCFLFVSSTGYFLYHSWRLKADGRGSPTWAMFLFLSSLLAFGAAYLVGSYSFATTMQPYFEVMNLNAYPSVDPKNYTGQKLMDMGMVTFTDNATIDLTKAMGFKSFDTYCVAPVVSSEGQMSVYDFWAVGVNCCKSRGAEFACGDSSNAKAHSGLRLMSEELRAFFRLAVQQAEAQYGIRTSQPIFLYWMQDPSQELNTRYVHQALANWVVGAFLFFVIQLVLVIAATIAFSKGA